jgi:predicted lipoprotein with Yx(FWY)xxD motif
VNGKGDTVYEFTKDTAGSGKSTCNSGCDSTWPPLTTSSSNPSLKGISGSVGTIKRSDGSMQVTLDGMPLYTYSGDSKAGDVSGQGMNSTWYVVSPDGTQITKAPGSSSSGSSGGSGAGGGWS